MNYFSLAVALTRAEAAPTLAKLAAKHLAIQQIAADSHERMLASFRSDRAKKLLRETCERTQSEVDAEELAVFGRAEARAINNGFN